MYRHPKLWMNCSLTKRKVLLLTVNVGFLKFWCHFRRKPKHTETPYLHGNEVILENLFGGLSSFLTFDKNLYDGRCR